MARWLPLALVVFAAIMVALNGCYTVPQTHQAIILRLGSYQSTINTVGKNESGLHFKIPFVDSAVLYEKRELGLALQTNEDHAVIAADQERLVVDMFMLWRIRDPRLFYRAARTENEGVDRLKLSADAALRRVLGSANSNDIIAERRAALMQAIRADLNNGDAAQLGVEIVDVRIRKADFPTQIEEGVYQRMITERAQEAARIRAEGARAATTIRAEADRDVTITLATAREQSERLRGQGESERARIFAGAYGRDPEFASFYRSMRAYDAAIADGTPIVVPTDSDFFRYMRNRNAGGGR